MTNLEKIITEKNKIIISPSNVSDFENYANKFKLKMNTIYMPSGYVSHKYTKEFVIINDEKLQKTVEFDGIRIVVLFSKYF